jgi:peptidyl-prolyl cis-trans isomerase A (cyclophilin A)
LSSRLSSASAVAFALLLASSAFAGSHPVVTFKTDMGDIVVELDAEHAPGTTGNFLKYVESGAFSGGSFFRTVTTHPDNQQSNPVKIDVIQGGPNPKAPALLPIPLERTNVTGLHHKDGTISMARGGPDSATDEFFFCIGDQPELDFGGRRNPDGQGFAAFGHVLKGMDVVKKIHESPANGQSLNRAITIASAIVIKP